MDNSRVSICSSWHCQTAALVWGNDYQETLEASLPAPARPSGRSTQKQPAEAPADDPAGHTSHAATHSGDVS
ncbi:hypothetical protein GCM10011575_30320 [Microlunatus endophyticus]|uniref:Uncharacterized protein n=1 Tax=Microlunatus endophyticus TaxID=1716077 RepID=A0A917W586_9ACTN|nr:hypothetical protein GCM10011575_30320 [Microlunatus endophyticus]